MNTIKLTILSILLLLFTPIFSQDACAPVGWATEWGTVNGANGANVTVVTNASELDNALSNASGKTIIIDGEITVSGMGTYKDEDNVTLLGLPGSKLISDDYSKDGSGIFYFERITNFIIRNVYFEGPGAYDTDGLDLLCIDNCQGVWVDHCEFHDGTDGNFDIKDRANYISVTWCTFSYEKPPIPGGSGGSDDHRYTNLIGSSDSATEDAGLLNTTFQYCWWKEGCRERMPRVRYGKIHLINNLFTSTVANYCARAGYEADIYIENNAYINTNDPCDIDHSSATVSASGNFLSGTNAVATQGTSFNPYSYYSLSNTVAGNAVQALVEDASCGAGQTLDINSSGVIDCGCSSTPTLTLSSGSDDQSIPDGDAIENIVYAFGGSATSASVTGLPSGVSASTSGSSPITISGTPSVTGTYNYTITATDGSNNVQLTGTIVIIPLIAPTLSLSSGSTTQTFIDGNAMTDIVYTWGGGATSATASNLPAGVSANISGSTITLTGTPTETGTFNYTVTTVGGLTPMVSLGGTITINTPITLGDVTATYTMNGTDADVSWGAVANADGYNVKVCTSGGGGTSTIYDFNSETIGELATNTTLVNGLEVLAVSGDEVDVEAGSPGTFEGVVVTKVLDLQGSGVPADNRCIVVITDGAGTLTAYNNGGDTGRTLNIHDGTSVISGGTATNTVTATIPSAGTYYIYSGGSGIKVNLIAFSSASTCTETYVAAGTTYTVSDFDGATEEISVQAVGDGVTYEDGVYTVATEASTPVAATITLTSTGATESQNINTGAAITNITYTYTGTATITWTGTAGASTPPTGVTVLDVAGDITISGTPSATGTYGYTIDISAIAGGTPATASDNGSFTVADVPVNANLILSSGSASQTVDQLTAITNIIYTYDGSLNPITWTGTASSTTPPVGITVDTGTANQITISGTPTTDGVYTFTIDVDGINGGTDGSESGTLTVNAVAVDATISLTSAASTDAQTVNEDVAITSITYNYTGTFNTLTWSGTADAGTPPAGITINTGTAGQIIISGTPSAAGSYGYSIDIDGINGGTTDNTTGTLAVIVVAGASCTTYNFDAMVADVDLSDGSDKTQTIPVGGETWDVVKCRLEIAISRSTDNSIRMLYNTGELISHIVSQPESASFWVRGASKDTEFKIQLSEDGGATYNDVTTNINLDGTAATINGNNAVTVGYDAFHEISVTLNSSAANARIKVLNLGDPADGSSSSSYNGYLDDFEICLGADATAPTLDSSTPTNAATGIAINGDITLTMSENISLGAGTITLDGGSLGSISVLGSTITIPYSGLTKGVAYTLTIPANAIQDGAANFYTGGTISFTTIAPNTVSSLSDLTVAEGTLAPTFASGTADYTVTLPFSYSGAMPNVTPTLTDGTASLVTTQATDFGAGNQAAILVTAEDGLTTTTYTVTYLRAAATITNDISVFSINGTNGTISGTDISVVLPAGTNLSSLIPTITHDGETISPSGAQDFSSPVTYTVTAESSATQDYIVTVTKLIPVLTVCAEADFDFSTLIGTPSDSILCNVTGVNLAENITISVPAPFEVKLQGASTWSTSVTIPQSAGLADGNFEVRFNPSVATTTSGNILFSSLEATTVALPLEGATTGTSINSPANKDQTLAVNTALSDIVFIIGGSATTASLSAGSLPAGVSFDSGTLTISGTPTETGTFNYTITTDGSPGSSVSGTITVGAVVNASIILTSAGGTNAQSILTNTAITDITYDYTGTLNNIAWSGSSTTTPAGITVNTATNGEISISGTPTSDGTYNYTINIDGLFGGTTATASGSITATTPTYDITFNVTDGTNPISGATVTFNSQSGTTDAGGNYTFTAVTAGIQGYNVTQTGYTSESGSINVSTNATENVVLIIASAPKKIAYITNSSADNYSNDTKILPAYQGEFDVTLIESTTTGVDFSSYDLVVLSEVPGSGDAINMELEGINKPFLMMKPHAYKSTVWDWAAAGFDQDGSETAFTVTNTTHEVFSGLTFTGAGNNELEVLSSVAGGKGLMYADPSQFTVSGGTIDNIANIAGNTAQSGIFEIPVGTTVGGNTTTERWMQVGINSSSYANITDDGVTLMLNTAYYLMGLPIPASPNKDISTFGISGVNGTITGTNISVVMPAGTDLSSLIPSITHNGASISPTGAQDFSSPVVYTVTAADATIQNYTVTVSKLTPIITLCAEANFDYTTTAGTPSDSVICNVSGSNLAEDITIIIPAPFEMRLEGDLTWSTSLTITETGGSADRNIEVRFNPSVPTISSGIITFSSLEATTAALALEGQTTEPSISTPANKDQTVDVNTAISDIVFTIGGSATTAVLSGTLPTGVTFNAGTLTISGTPTVDGIFNYTITTDGTPTAAVSGTITVNAAANIAPTVSITNPTTGVCAEQGSTITLTATATDSDGTIATVAFYNGASLIGTASGTGPYTYEWTAPTSGAYTITAQATDNDTETTISNAITVNSYPTVTLTGAANFDEINCTTTDYTIGYTVSSGTVSSQLWSTTATSSTVTTTDAGAYNVVVTMDNSCTATSNTINLTKDVTVPTVTLTGAVDNDEINCTTADYTLGYTVSAGTVTAQTWSDASTAATLTSSDAGAFDVDVTFTNGCVATSNTINLTKDVTVPTVTLTGAVDNDEINCTTADYTLGYTVSSGTVASQVWSDASTAATLTSSDAGAFGVDVTFTNGCVATSNTINLTKDVTIPTVTLTGAIDNDEINCTTADYTLGYTVSSGTVASQVWSDASTAATLTSSDAGAFDVDVTFTNGCVATSNTINLTKDVTVPTVTLTGAVDNDEINCTTADYTLGYTVSSGTVASQVWSDASTAATLTSSDAGAFDVDVTFTNGCVATSNTINLTKDVTIPTVTLTGAVDNDEINCTTADYTLGYTVSSGTVASQVWSDASTAATLTSSDAGAFGVDVTFTNGCVATSNTINLTKDVTVPTVTLTGAVDNDEINCTTADYTLGYTVSSGTVASQMWSDASTALALTASDAGAYSVDVEFDNGCSATSNTINLTKDVTVPTVTLTGAVDNDEINCTTASYTLGYTVSAGTVTAQTWSDASTAATLTSSDAGAFDVDVTFTNGCVATSNTINLTKDVTIPTVTLTGAVDNDEINCTTADYTLAYTVSSGTVASQVWSDASTAATLTSSDAGAFDVDVTFTNGCVATSNTINLTKDVTVPTVTLTGAVDNDEINCTTADYTLGYTVSSGTVASQVWSDASTAATLTSSDAGAFDVDVTFTNGCVATSNTINLTKDVTVPTVTLTGAVDNDEINCTTTDYTLGYTVSSGTVASQVWSDASTAATLTSSDAGAFDVDVTFTNGCTATSNTINLSKDVTVPTVTLTGAIDNDEINCTVTSYTLGYTVSAGTVTAQTWSDASTALVLTTSDAGAYSVAIDFDNGCSANSNTINLSKDVTVPTVTLTGAVDNDEINCTVASYTLGYTVSAGTVTAQTWSDASTALALTTSDAGAYSVAIDFDNGCSANSNTINLSKDVTVPTVTLTGAVDNDEINCTVASYTLGYTVSAGTVTAQTWSDASTALALTASDAGAYSVAIDFDNGCVATSNTINLTKDVTIPTVTLTGAVDNDEINCTTADYTLAYTVSSGTVASQVWSDASTAATLTSSDAGAFDVDVTFTNGCVATSNTINLTKDVTVPTVTLTGAIDNDEINCTTASYTLGYTVSVGTVTAQTWSDASTALALTASDAGAYSVDVEFDNGCSATSNTINLTKDVTVPTVTLTGAIDNDEINCTTASYTLAYTVSSGTVASQVWSDASTAATLTSSDAGAFDVDVTFTNGCVATSNTINLTKDVTVPTVTLTGAIDNDEINCTTADYTLGYTVSSGTVASQVWSDASTAATLTSSDAGAFDVDVTFTNGCSATSNTINLTKDVTVPTVTLTGAVDNDEINCTTASYTLGYTVSAGTVTAQTWSDASTALALTASDAGAYSVDVEFDNGCSATSNTINLTKDVTVPTVTLTGAVDNDEINCTTASYTLGYTVSAGTVTAQTWSDASTALALTASDAGAYSVDVEFDNGCSATSNTINLTKDVTVPTVTLTGAVDNDEINCTTASYTLAYTVSSGTVASQVWSDASTAATLTSSDAGAFDVDVTFTNGCTATSNTINLTKDVTVPTVTLTGAIDNDEINCTTADYTLGYTVSSGTVASQVWSDASTAATLTSSDAGAFDVDVTFTNGCTATSNTINLTKDVTVPTVTLTGAIDNDEINCTTADYTLGYTVSSGTVASQVWSDASTAATLTSSDAGAFDVDVTFDNGCSATSNTINLTKDVTVPTVTLTGAVDNDEINCTTADYTLGYTVASGTVASQVWSDASTAATLTSSDAGAFDVDVTFTNGCVATSNTINLTKDVTIPTVTLTGAVDNDEINCTTADYTLGYTVSSGTVASQVWSDASTAATLTSSDAGAFDVDVTFSNGCVATSNTINLTKDVTIPTVTLTGAVDNDEINCTTTDYTLGYTVSSGTVASQVWSDASTAATLTSSDAGAFDVDVTFSNGCVATSNTINLTKDVTVPTVTLTGAVDNDEINCTTADYTLGYTVASGTVASQVWSDASTAATLTSSDAGAFDVDVTFTNGCVATSNTINLTKDVTIPTVTLTGAVDNDEINCTTADYTLGYTVASGTVASQVWSDASTAATLTSSDAGAFDVDVTFSNGCVATSNTINLTKDVTIPTVTLTGAVDNDEINCTTTDYTLGYTVSSGTVASQVWSDASTAATLTSSDAGAFDVDVTFTNGCVATSNTINLTKDVTVPTVTLTGAVDNDEINCTTADYTLGYTVSSGTVASQVWSDASTAATLTSSDAGAFGVDVTFTNGCTATSNTINLTKDVTVPTVTLTGAVDNDEINCTTASYTLGYTVSAGTVTAQTWSDASTALALTASDAGAYSVDVEFDNGCSATSNTINLTKDVTVPTVTLTGAVDNDEINCTTASYTLGYTVSAGTVTAQTWSDASTALALTASDAGAYSVDVEFDNGCSATSNTINLTKDVTVPTVTLTGAVDNDEINCTTASYTLGYTVSAGTVTAQTWSDASTALALTASDAGAYSVDVEFDNGCSATSNTINLTKDVTVPTVTLTGAVDNDEINCTVASYTLGYIVSAGTVTAQTWSDASTALALTASDAGAYSVAIDFDNGCSATSNTINLTKDVTVPTVTLTGAVDNDEINCTTADYTLGYTVSAGTVTAQTWSDASTALALTASDAGAYSVDVEFDNGCSATSNTINLTKDVTIPTVTLTGAVDNDEINCTTASYTLGYTVSAGTVTAQTWSDASTALALTASDAGAYSVAIDFDNGCSANSNTINLSKDVTVPTVTLTGAVDNDEINCTVASYTLGYIVSAGTVTAQTWSDASTALALTASDAGAYSVDVEFDNGCSATSNTINLTKDVTVPTVTLTGAVDNDEINCTTASYTLAYTVSSGTVASQVWSDASTAATLTSSDAGAFDVDVTFTNGCVATSNTINLTKDVTVPTVTLTGAIDNDEINCTTASYTLGYTVSAGTVTAQTWSDASTALALTASDAGAYSVAIDFDNGCSATSNTINLTKDVTVPTVTLTGAVDNDEINCTTASYTLGYTVSAGTVTAQTWSDASTALALTASDAGAYSVDVEFDNGCSATSNTINLTKDVTVPTVTLTGAVDNDEINCTTASYTLGYTVSAGTVTAQTWSDASTALALTASDAGAYSVAIDFDNGCSATSNTINLTKDVTVPTVTLTGAVDNDEINCTTASYTLGYTVSAGTVTAQTWSDASTALALTASDAGAYSVDVEFDNGCSATSNTINLTKDVTVPTVTLTGAIDNDEINCTTASYTLGYTVSAGTVTAQTWSDASTALALTASDAGAYSVDVEFDNGCSATSNTINLTKDVTVPTVTLTGAIDNDEINCTTASYTLGYTVSVGTVTAQTWSDASTALALTASDAGAYSVDVEFDNGCSATSNTINLTKDVTVPTVTLTGAIDNDEINCTTASYTLGYTVSAGTVTAQTWSDASTALALTASDAGAYSVDVEFDNGCSATSNTINLTKDVTVPTVTLTGAVDNDEINCTTASYTLGYTVSAGTVTAQTWSDASTALALTASDAGAYSVAIDFDNGCSATSNTINLTKDVTVPTVTLTGAVDNDEINCTTASYTLGYTVSAGTVTAQTWSDASTALALTASDAGAYSVDVEFDNGCVATSNTINLTKDVTVPTVTLTGAIDNDEINCTTASYTLGYTVSAGTVTAQTWSDASTALALTASDAGAYSVDVEFDNGCSATSNTINLTKDVTVPTVTLTGAIDNDEINCTTASYTLGYTVSVGTVTAQTWSDASTALALTASDAGAYSVDVEFDNGCSATSNTINLTKDVTVPTVTLTGAVDNDEINCTTASYTLAYTVSSGTVASQVWSDASTAATLTSSDAGAFDVDVTFTNGCVATSNTINLTKDVTVPTVTLTGAIDNDEINCTTADYTLGYTVSSGTVASQVWSDASTAATLTSSDAGAFDVDVTFTNGCVATSNTINLTKDVTVPTVTLTGAVDNDEINCTTASYTLGYTVSAGTVTAQTWSDASTALALTTSDAGAYSVAIDFDNGCSANSNTINLSKDVTVPTVTLTGAIDNDEINCTTADYTLGYTVSSGTVASQVWSDASTAATLTSSDAGAFDVDVTFTNGCVATSNTINLTKDVTIPTVTLTGAVDNDEINCTTASYTLGYTVSAGTVTAQTWSDASTALALTASDAGAYSVDVEFDNGCSATSNTINLTKDVTVPTVTLTGAIDNDEINCTTASYTLGYTVSAGTVTAQTWSDASTALALTASDAGAYSVDVEFDNGCSATSNTINLTKDVTVPTVTLTGAVDNDEINCTTASYTLAYTVSSGTVASQVWSDASTAATLTSSDAGAFDVDVTFTNGCTATSNTINLTKDVTVPTVTLTGAIDNDEINCTTADYTLGYTVSSGTVASQVWSDASTALALTASDAGTYSVNVEFDNGCSATSNTINLTKDVTVPTVTLTGAVDNDEINCTTASYTLGYTVSAGTVTAQTWSDASTALALTASDAGAYSVDVEFDNGCSATSNTINLTKDVTVPTVTLTGAIDNDEINCTTASYTLGYTVSAGTVTAQTWSDASTALALTASDAGAYSVDVTLSNGCTASSNTINLTKDISAPAIAITGAGEITCITPTLTLTANQVASTYSWTLGGTPTGSSIQTLDATVAGNYAVTATYANGCSASNTVNVTSNISIPTVTLVGASDGDQIDCNTTNYTLSYTVSGGTIVSQLWSTSIAGTSISVSDAGAYDVAITFDNGCIGTSNTINLTKDISAPAISITGDTVLTCATTSLLLGNNQTGKLYNWTKDGNPFASTPSTSVNQTGKYQIAVTYANGCTANSSTSVIEDKNAPDVTINNNIGDTINCTNTIIPLTSSTVGATYAWTKDGAAFATSPSIDVIDAGAYALTVTYDNGCTKAATQVSITKVACILAELTNPTANKDITIEEGTYLEIVFTVKGSATTIPDIETLVKPFLPAGLIATISGKNLNIYGNPTETGTFPYSITTDGNSPVTMNGTITVTAKPPTVIANLNHRIKTHKEFTVYVFTWTGGNFDDITVEGLTPEGISNDSISYAITENEGSGSITIFSSNPSQSKTYTIKTMDENGVEKEYTGEIKAKGHRVYQKGRQLHITGEQVYKVQIYSPEGKYIQTKEAVNQIDLDHLLTGGYVIKITDSDKSVECIKFMWNRRKR